MVIIFLYFALFLMVHFLAKRFDNTETARRFEIVCCFLLLFIFFGFRDITVLNDSPHYYRFYYHRAQSLSYLNDSIFTFRLLDQFEYGFQVLVHFLIKYVSRNPYTIIILSSLVIAIGELWFISQHCKDIAKMCFVMLVSNLLFTHFCIIRQAFAILLFYIAFGYFRKGKMWKYVLLILCAGLFHYSAYFLLFLPLICKNKPSWKNAIIAIGISIVLAAFTFELLTVLGLRDHPYYKAAVQKNAISIIGLADFALLSFIVGVIAYAHRLSGKVHIDAFYFWICTIALCVSIVSLVIYPIARVNEYLWPLILFMLFKYIDPNAMKEPFSPSFPGIHRLLQILIVLVFAAKMIGINAFRPEWQHYTPYKFYRFDQKRHNFNIYRV